MDTMIAYCGLDCAGCPIHVATLESDSGKQRALKTDIARMCAEHYGMAVTVKDITDCDGCCAQTGRLFSGCAKCEIRRCATGRELRSCAFCPDFTCEKLSKHFQLDPTARTRLEAIRSANQIP